MGPPRARDRKLPQDDVKVLLREKDERIATLETRVEAYSARASTAQIRLLKTIDVLDSLRSQHALETSVEEQEKLKLVQEANRWRNVAKSLEVEKDELKDVVEDLIEKEQPALGTIIGSEEKKDNHNGDLLAFATSIIARLRMELEFERQNHTKTVEEANLRIEELEAKIAVREAELETCITSPSDYERQPEDLQNVSTHAFEKSRYGKKLSKPKPLSDEECLRLLESNSARNRALEVEIRQIAERLERARTVISAPSGTLKEPHSPALRSDCKAIPAPSPRTRSASVDPSTLSRPLDAEKAMPAPASPTTMLSIVQLDNQIRTMTAQIDALVAERTTLIKAAARQRRSTDGINMDTFQDVLRVEGECVRLQAEVDDLREQLQHARSFARARENVLLQEIAQLRASSSSSAVPHPAQDLHRTFSPQPLEADIVIEESMELASPILPTVAPDSLSARSSRSLDAEVDLVLFPTASPNRTFSPVLDAPITPPRNTRHNSSPQDIERVQAALDVARTHLAQKEEALTQLCTEMERLQQELHAQTREDGDGC